MSDARDKDPRDGAEDPDAPPSAEEIERAASLREALERHPLEESDDETALAASLRAAWSPTSLAEGEHREILDALPTAEELEAAAALADSLESRGKEPDHDEILSTLRLAWNPTDLGAEDHEIILARVGLARGEGGAAKVIPLAARPRRTVRVLAIATTSVLALAASVLVWLSTADQRTMAPLARARSTQPLFDEPFKPGETSARIDKIAIARATDFRDNRFAKWGVR